MKKVNENDIIVIANLEAAGEMLNMALEDLIKQNERIPAEELKLVGTALKTTTLALVKLRETFKKHERGNER